MTWVYFGLLIALVFCAGYSIGVSVESSRTDSQDVTND